MNLYHNSINTFDLINPTLVLEYLLETGWMEEEKIDGRSVILSICNETGKKFSIMLPLNKDIPDFFYRMAEVFTALEAFEQKLKTQILSNFIDN